MIVVGIDPGTGVSSPTGVVVFDYESKDIYDCQTLDCNPDNRLVDLRMDVTEIFSQIWCEFDTKDVLVCVETFVMRGKAGMNLQRLIGAFLSSVPCEWRRKEVYNTTVKKVVGHHGRAEKEQVARGVKRFFKNNPASCQIVVDLIKWKDWDTLDAFAIGITGAMLEKDPEANKYKRPAKKASSNN